MNVCVFFQVYVKIFVRTLLYFNLHFSAFLCQACRVDLWFSCSHHAVILTYCWESWVFNDCLSKEHRKYHAPPVPASPGLQALNLFSMTDWLPDGEFKIVCFYKFKVNLKSLFKKKKLKHIYTFGELNSCELGVFRFNVSYSSCWGYSLINTLKLNICVYFVFSQACKLDL